MKNLLEMVSGITGLISMLAVIILLVNFFRFDGFNNGLKYTLECTWTGGCKGK